MNNKINNYVDEELVEDTLIDKYLTFFIESQLFGIPIVDVIQIVSIQEITAVPEFPDYAKGVINLRGAIIPIIDVRIRLKKEEAPYDDRTCIIVTKIEGSLIGFIVDSVNEVTDIPKENISGPPNMGEAYVNIYITGIANLNDEIVLIMDIKKILNEKEITSITHVESIENIEVENVEEV